MQTLDNTLMGDSYLKVRFAECIIMLRQDRTKSITDQAVMRDVFDDDYNISGLTALDYHSTLIPMLLKITKAKEGDKDVDKYHIFNPLNLRISDSFTTVADDMVKYKLNNEELIRDIESIGLVISEDIIFDVDGDEIENLIL